MSHIPGDVELSPSCRGRRIPQPIEVGCAQGAIKETVAGFAGFPPNHAAVIRPQGAVEAVFIQRL